MNRGTLKSTILLITCTILFAMIAEILVTTVDALLVNNKSLDEKFLGVTLFAIVPSFTEFYNAVAFGMNGNIALSLEIASAYTIQVALLQIPTLVIFSGKSKLLLMLLILKYCTVETSLCHLLLYFRSGTFLQY